MWVAFAPVCRLILDFVIGPGKQYVADKLVELVTKHLSDKIPVFVTDGLNFYNTDPDCKGNTQRKLESGKKTYIPTNPFLLS